MTVLEPRGGSDPAALFCDYLDFYRQVVDRKLRSLSEAELCTSRLPSGWTPLELLTHLVHMEQRWFVWGFAGEAVADPWGDNRDAAKNAAWAVAEGISLEELLNRLHEGGRRTRAIIESHPLDAQAPPGPRFAGRYAEQTASLAWICFHVLQEYARHTGHLDVAVELADGLQGE
ncbi:DUF664 domain-containing protein [Naumannella sp. ID2617S]|nr:DUF664 domain-containing protein [Naumannella sp. ID2617S]